MKRILTKNNIIVILILAVMFVVGMVTARDYGYPLDERMEVGTIVSNIKEYGMHLPEGSGLRNKVESWIKQNSAGIVEISQSTEKDHGVAAYYPLAAAFGVAKKSLYVNSMLFLHCYTFALFFAGILALYFICRELFQSQKVSLLAAGMLYLTPRMFAEGHYDNKDIVFFSLVLLIILFGIKLIRRPKFSYAVWFGLAAAFATNTKILGGWFYGVIGIVYLISLIQQKTFTRRTLLIGLTAIGVWAVMYALITPAMWNDPVGYFQWVIQYSMNFTRWEGQVLFQGNIYEYSSKPELFRPLPHYYLPYMMLITIPVYIWILFAAGVGILIYRVVKGLRKAQSHCSTKGAEGMVALILFLGAMPLLYAVCSGMTVYNGWRHFYFVYGPMMILCAYGVNCLWEWLRNQNKYRKLAGISALAAAMGITGIMLFVNHPFQYSYYNVLAGKDIEQKYELDYWDVATLGIMHELYEDVKGTTVDITGYDTWSRAGVTKAVYVMNEEERKTLETYNTDWRDADYIVVNTSYARMAWDENYEYITSHYSKEYSSRAYGNEIAAIYKKAQ